MLSATNELTDIKVELEDYRVYDYTDKEFTESATTNTSTSITGIGDTAEIIAGQTVTGTGIPASTTVSSVDGKTAITISNAATASATVTLTFSKSGNTEFNAALTEAVSKVERERMIPIMGESSYNTYAALDKDGLSTTQLNVYWAEVYWSVAEFALFLAKKDKFVRGGARESRTQGDVTEGTSGTVGKQLFAEAYIRKAQRYMAEGGYDSGIRLTRRISIHGS